MNFLLLSHSLPLAQTLEKYTGIFNLLLNRTGEEKIKRPHCTYSTNWANCRLTIPGYIARRFSIVFQECLTILRPQGKRV